MHPLLVYLSHVLEAFAYPPLPHIIVVRRPKDFLMLDPWCGLF